MHLPVRGHICPMCRPCAHGCHKILANWQLAEAAAAREGLHALGSPHTAVTARRRGTRCAHQLMTQHGSQMSFELTRFHHGRSRDSHGRSRDRVYRGYSHTSHDTAINQTHVRATMTCCMLHLGTFFCQRVRGLKTVVGRLLGKPVAFGCVSERSVVLLCKAKSENMVCQSCDDVTCANECVFSV